jgi:hypothetical protein
LCSRRLRWPPAARYLGGLQAPQPAPAAAFGLTARGDGSVGAAAATRAGVASACTAGSAAGAWRHGPAFAGRAGALGGAGRGRRATGGSIDAWRRRCRDRQGRWRCRRRARRDEHDAQIGHLDPPFLPGQHRSPAARGVASEGQGQERAWPISEISSAIASGLRSRPVRRGQPCQRRVMAASFRAPDPPSVASPARARPRRVLGVPHLGHCTDSLTDPGAASTADQGAPTSGAR